MTMCDDITRVRARAAASATGTHRRTRRATDAMGRRASETRDGGRRRGKMTLALAAMASACGARGAAAAVTELRTLAGSFKFKTDLSSASNVTITSKTAYVKITEALKLSEHVAHFAAELATFDGVGSDWDDMTEDYDAWIKQWVEDLGKALYSNEWVRLTGNKIPIVNGTEVVVSSDPLRSYVEAAVAKAKSDAGSIDAMKEIIEKTVWDAAGYQASLKALATAQEVDSSSPKNGVCVSGPSQTDATKAHWDLGAALIIGDGYHSVLGRAQKRGFEFGTIGATGVAKAYEKIMKLLRAGQEEKTCAGSDMTLHEIYERIEWQMRVVYSQSILKYVYKMDMAIASGKVTAAFHDLHAEGQAMYRVIAGDVMAKAPPEGAWLN